MSCHGILCYVGDTVSKGEYLQKLPSNSEWPSYRDHLPQDTLIHSVP